MGTTKPRHMSPSQSVAVVSLLVAVAAVALHRFVPLPAAPSLLSVLAAGEFAWSASTTDIPISSVSVLAKSVLSRDVGSLPRALRAHISATDSIFVQPLRAHAHAGRLLRARALCALVGCDPSEQEGEFGLTPLHLAAFANDHPLYDFLVRQGAVPKMDHAGRLPRNLSFTNFIRNAKKARKDGDDCDFPVADFASDPAHARREAARLVGEGEPVLMRGALWPYVAKAEEHQQTQEAEQGAATRADSDFLSLRNWDAERWVAKFGHASVRVGAVPYANAFNLTTRDMTLRDFYQRFVRQREADNLYVFNKNDDISRTGYDALARLVREALPVGGSTPLIADPDTTGALDGIHFFFGRSGSGAPFHLHGDAVNAAVHGRKRWFVYTPGRSIYSRKPAKQWVEEELENLPTEERPLECVQHPGDVIYVPLDWAHGVLNLDENTFGFALELLNRRDTYAHITGH